MTIADLDRKVREGGRVDRHEALDLYLRAPTSNLGRLADDIRARKHPERLVTYIIDRNVNYTNICVARCNFCAFYRPVGSSEGYVLGFDEIFRKIDETIALGGGQLLLQGAPIETEHDTGADVHRSDARFLRRAGRRFPRLADLRQEVDAGTALLGQLGELTVAVVADGRAADEHLGLAL